MLLSKKWLMGLNPAFEILNSDNMNDALNCLGQELEGVRVHYQVNDLCVGLVKEFHPHPNSDHLNVCTVQTKNDVRTIVCGAPHMYANRYVCVANVGSTMVNGLTLAAKPLRGVDSHGMICAFHELTNTHTDCLSKFEKDNVIFLNNDVDLNTNIYDYLGLDDEMYDVFVQANRNDLNGAYYLGQSLAAYFNLDYPQLNNVKLPHIKQTNVYLKTEIVGGIGLMKLNTNHQNLMWKQKTVLLNGAIKTQDNISDFASYFSYLFAVPYLAFDAEKVTLPLTLKHIDHELEWTVDNKPVKINVGDLVVVDAKDTVVSYMNLVVNPALVSDTANSIYLLSFNADPYIVRRGVLANKLNNQNSLLAVKPNTNAMIINSQQAVYDDRLNLGFAKQNVDLLATCEMNEGNTVNVTLEQVNKFLGTNLTFDQYSNVLTKYGFKVTKKSVTSSPIRTDSHNMQDIAEDVLVGFNLNDMSVQPISFSIKNSVNPAFDLNQKIANYLVDIGLYNAKTYNLTSHESADLFNWYQLNVLDLKNPGSNLKASFNTNKIDSLLNVLAYNQRAKNPAVNWFEIAKLYVNKQQSFDCLTILLDTNWSVDKLSGNQLTNSLYSALSLVNNLLVLAHKPPLKDYNLKYNVDLSGCYRDNSICIVYDERIIGYIGQITKNTLKNYKLSQDVFAISLNLNTLFAIKPKSEKVQAFSNFNDITRNINVLADYDVNLQKVLGDISKIEYIINCQIIDKYQDDKGTAYIIELIINNPNKALETKELDSIQQQVLQVLDTYQLKLK